MNLLAEYEGGAKKNYPKTLVAKGYFFMSFILLLGRHQTGDPHQMA